ncbi:hypothetical protein [Desulfotignum phosphitoxidans]|uniref:Uncharacterized protein n=1 Tax=Desulfotignum phosphitoxidans DSM 13687 TaxID=1286635 RepID=S0G186_9BACT|nr:hypothetical protein [Desulfotignum phosphitoxidans]EMS79184.1 hypothetical protein Dpo_5c01070 [Desulfotignum phosphitoxidans DSM 13687]
MRLSVHGSRTLEDERVKVLLMNEILEHKITMIVTHAEPGGVCQVARKLAKEMALPLKLHFLNFKYRGGAFERRSKAVLKDCDRAIFIHDGKSKGTTNELRLAEKMNKAKTVHVMEKSEHKTSVGFGIEEPWDWKEDDQDDEGPSLLSEMVDVSEEEFMDLDE